MLFLDMSIFHKDLSQNKIKTIQKLKQNFVYKFMTYDATVKGLVNGGRATAETFCSIFVC